MYWFMRMICNEMWIEQVQENDEQADDLLLELAKWGLDVRSREGFGGVVDALRALSECGADTVSALEQYITEREEGSHALAPALWRNRFAPQSHQQVIGGPFDKMPPRQHRGFLIGAALVLCQGALRQQADRQAAAKLLLSGAAGIYKRQSRLMLEGIESMNLDE